MCSYAIQCLFHLILPASEELDVFGGRAFVNIFLGQVNASCSHVGLALGKTQAGELVFCHLPFSVFCRTCFLFLGAQCSLGSLLIACSETCRLLPAIGRLSSLSWGVHMLTGKSWPGNIPVVYTRGGIYPVYTRGGIYPGDMPRWMSLLELLKPTCSIMLYRVKTRNWRGAIAMLHINLN